MPSETPVVRLTVIDRVIAGLAIILIASAIILPRNLGIQEERLSNIQADIAEIKIQLTQSLALLDSRVDKLVQEGERTSGQINLLDHRVTALEGKRN